MTRFLLGALTRAVRRVEGRHRAWRYRVRLDPDEIRWMRSQLAPGDVAVDIGAYKGGYTYWMRREVDATGLVLSFEPQPELYAFLERTVEAFGWENVRVERLALSASPGTRTLHAPREGPSQGASLSDARLEHAVRHYPVAVGTLDAYLADRVPDRTVRLIKCDVEGHELEVFRGARRVLETHRPDLLFECEARHRGTGSVQEVFEHLEQVGYSGWFFRSGELFDVRTFDAGRYQIEGVRPYSNNFLFRHSSRGGPETTARSSA